MWKKTHLGHVLRQMGSENLFMSSWLVLLLIAVCVELCRSTAVPCSTIVNGTTIDLSSLSYDPRNPNPPLGYSFPSGGNTYYVNFCNKVSSVTYPDCSRNGPSGSCQLSAGVYNSAGLVSTQVFVPFVRECSPLLIEMILKGRSRFHLSIWGWDPIHGRNPLCWKWKSPTINNLRGVRPRISQFHFVFRV